MRRWGKLVRESTLAMTNHADPFAEAEAIWMRSVAALGTNAGPLTAQHLSHSRLLQR